MKKATNSAVYQVMLRGFPECRRRRPHHHLARHRPASAVRLASGNDISSSSLISSVITSWLFMGSFKGYTNKEISCWNVKHVPGLTSQDPARGILLSPCRLSLETKCSDNIFKRKTHPRPDWGCLQSNTRLFLEWQLCKDKKKKIIKWEK